MNPHLKGRVIEAGRMFTGDTTFPGLKIEVPKEDLRAFTGNLIYQDVAVLKHEDMDRLQRVEADTEAVINAEVQRRFEAVLNDPAALHTNLLRRLTPAQRDHLLGEELQKLRAENNELHRLVDDLYSRVLDHHSAALLIPDACPVCQADKDAVLARASLVRRRLNEERMTSNPPPATDH